MLEILNGKDPNVVGVVLLFVAVIFCIGVYSTEQIKNISKKITFHNVATLVVFSFFFLWGLSACIKCLLDEPADKALIFLKKYIFGESNTTYGLVYLIDQHDEPIYCSGEDTNYFPNPDDIKLKPFYIVKILDLRSTSQIFLINFCELRDNFCDEFELALLSKCKIQYRTWWWTGQHMFFMKIQPIS